MEGTGDRLEADSETNRSDYELRNWDSTTVSAKTISDKKHNIDRGDWVDGGVERVGGDNHIRN